MHAGSLGGMIPIWRSIILRSKFYAVGLNMIKFSIHVAVSQQSVLRDG
jgi:hypothetical protein